GTAPGTQVQVFDNLGRLVLTATADAAGSVTLALPTSLPNGLYVVRTGTTTTRLVIN
ncbi:MAG: T9SS type A sorting domain-containing protein, partial [Hymenobacter sp.]